MRNLSKVSIYSVVCLVDGTCNKRILKKCAEITGHEEHHMYGAHYDGEETASWTYRIAKGAQVATTFANC